MDLAKLADLRKQVTDYIHDRTLGAHLDAARKAEFKGQLKKALDAYQEALFSEIEIEVADELNKDLEFDINFTE